MKSFRLLAALVLIFVLRHASYSQLALPADRCGSWELAGFSETSREVPRRFGKILDLKQRFGAIADGIADDYTAIDSAIRYHRSLQGSNSTLIILPPGAYRLNTRIVLNQDFDDGIVFRGAGSSLTTLVFSCDESTSHLIEIRGGRHDIGIENLKIVREGDANDKSSNIFIGNSYSCWITGIESVNPMQYHVYISDCQNIVVKGSYFHEASHYGSCNYPYILIPPYLAGPERHTHGYGVCVDGDTSMHCLIEDNIFRFLRHGITFNQFAHDNVAIFNYVREGHALGFFAPLGGEQSYKDWDILCHGKGNYRNLIEANVVDLLGVDSNVFQSGPYNTFFRNRALYDNVFYHNWLSYDEASEFIKAPSLNIVGNAFMEIDGNMFEPIYNDGCGETRLDILAFYGSGLVGHCSGLPLPLYFTQGYLPTASLYYTSLTSPPEHESLPGYPWPLIGPRLSPNSPFPPQLNAAYYRWGDTKKTVDAKPVTQFQVNVLVENSFPGSSASGSLTVNGNSYQLPVSAFVLPGGSTIQLTAPVQYHSSVSYSPSHWTNDFLPNESFTGANISVPLVRDVKFTAHYVPIPDPPPNIQPLGDVGEQPHLIWQEHPNPNVLKYQIWRVIKPYNQNALPATQIAELNRGTTQFTDEEFVVTSGRTNDLVSYDVRAVLVVSGNSYYSTPCWYTYFARGGAVPNIVGPHTDPFAVGQITEETLTSLELNAFPNPFNPSTCVNFSISAPSYISLILFDMLGREVTRLRDGMIAAGSYSNNLDASHLSAGVYFLRLTQLSEGKPPQSVARRIILSK